MATLKTNMIDSAQERISFSLELPETFNFGFDVVDTGAEDPTKLALLWVDDDGHNKRYSFADIRREWNRFASVLQGRGMRQGDCHTGETKATHWTRSGVLEKSRSNEQLFSGGVGISLETEEYEMKRSIWGL